LTAASPRFQIVLSVFSRTALSFKLVDDRRPRY
jgi:hypothetical protein